MIDMASRLRSLRMMHKYSQKDFSAKLGVPLTTYNTWERGESYPNHKIILEIVDMFDISLDYIYCRTDEMNKTFSNMILDKEVDKEVLRRIGLTNRQIKKLDNEMTTKIYDFAEVVIKAKLYDVYKNKLNE